MNTIYKYPLEPGHSTIEMPRAAQILTVQAQNEMPYVWALVETEYRNEERNFVVFGTGFPIPADLVPNLKYINTFMLAGGSLVYHAFERLA